MFTFLQGTWFYQVAFALYHPTYQWDTSDDRLTANITFIYAMHFFAVVTFILLVHCGVYILVRGGKNSKNNNNKSGRYRIKTQKFYGVEYEVCCDDAPSTDDDDGLLINEKSNTIGEKCH